MAPITLTPQSTSLPPSCISISDIRSVLVPHPMSERDYSWQPLSLHTISSGAKRFFFLFQSISEYLWVPRGSSRIPRCRLRGLYLSMFTMTCVLVNIYALTFVPSTRLIISGNELLIRLLTDPLFRHFSSSVCVLDLRAADQRAFYSLLIGYLKPAKPPSLRILRAPPRYGWESSLLWRTRHSFHSLSSSPKLHVSCDHLYMLSSTRLHRDAMHTFTPIRACTHVCPVFSFGSLDFMISVFGSLYPHALPPSASPAML